jgi:ATP-dependent helicase/nuclease subunit B
VAARPRKLSVTAIETWIANPYAIFAKHILKLDALDPLGVRPGAALRGQVVHAALGRLTQRYPRELPRNLAEELAAIAREVLAEYTSNPRVAAFWAPRLARFAHWFAQTEGARRAGVKEVVAETTGELVLAAPGGPFTLSARADRIDVGEGGLIVTDYKSSQSLVDLKSRANAGRAPQLPLEAAIAAAGRFAGVPAAAVTMLRYISTAGGEPPGHEAVLDGDAAAMAREAREGLVQLIAEFDEATTPYRALRRARFKYDYDAYAHLARVAEWSAEDEEED